MPENTDTQVQSSDPEPRQNPNLKLTSLAPRYEEDEHGLYYRLLVQAIGAEGTCNIAVTGAYGAGKSSVLEKLRTSHDDETVWLALSTISPEASGTDDSDAEHANDDGFLRTNQIQQEIVKQLLYKLPPRRTPRSRFRRVNAPNSLGDWLKALLFGFVAFAVLSALGLIQPLVESLFSPGQQQDVGYALLFTATVVAAWGVIRIAQARPSLSASVQAGAATVTLSEKPNSYFDKYLDEIVYFFQVSKCSIVVIEDIDRFKDVRIFDTLRALNSLLNNAGQIDRRIVFIYAIRDSVFEQIGADPTRTGPKGKESGSSAGDRDRAKVALDRASRTKFFDVIIPVVPFVSAENARDMMSKVMTSDHFTIDPALIRVASRHVADMRLIYNIRNEFEVYRDRLMFSEIRIRDITDDLVFAMTLFKNTHLADFERIRHQESALDRLYMLWRELVRQNLKAHTDRLTQHQEAHRLARTREARAAELGTQLAAFRDMLLSSIRKSDPSGRVTLSGPATDENLDDPQAWEQIASGTPQQVILRQPSFSSQNIGLSFTAEQLAGLLGVHAIDSGRWVTADLENVATQVKNEQETVAFLRHHTWKDLCDRSDLTVEVSNFGLTGANGEHLTGSLTFDEIVQAVLESDLARDLVRHGFLTSHFALYMSSYYGTHLGPDALEYLHRHIEPGEPDTGFPIPETEVIQLLREQKADENDNASLLSDPCIYNISIMNYLLAKKPNAADTVARSLARFGERERTFIDTYIGQGEHPGKLLATLAPHWAQVVQYAAIEAPTDDAGRVPLLNEILRELPNSHFQVKPDTGIFLKAHYKEIEAICKPAGESSAQNVMLVVRSSGAVLESLTPLNSAARTAAIKLGVYTITRENLRVIVPNGVFALDVVRDNEPVYAHVLSNLADYLFPVKTNSRVFKTVSDPAMFAEILTDIVKKTDGSHLRSMIDKSSRSCRVADLSTVDIRVWAALAATDRTNPSFQNVTAYLKKIGMDDALAALLTKNKKITEADQHPENERLELAITLLAASEKIPPTTIRVDLAASLTPGVIPAASLTPEKGDLIAKMLRKGILADDASAFSETLMLDWETREAAIAASKRFAIFVSPEVLPVDQLLTLHQSAIIGQSAKALVVSSITSNVSQYFAHVNSDSVSHLAQAFIQFKSPVSFATIQDFQARGTENRQLIQLIHHCGEGLAITDLKALLRAMGGDYARVATGGRRQRPNFISNPAIEDVLTRLVGDTIDRIEPKRFQKHGGALSLVAHLTMSS